MSKRINIKDLIKNDFVQVPKALLFEPRYLANKETGAKGLSNDAKLLYGILFDRTTLSKHSYMKNGDDRFIDANGDLFIYFDNVSIEKVLNISNKKAMKLKKELITFELIEEVKQGQGLASRLYVNTVEIDPETLDLYIDNFLKTVDEKKESEKKRIAKHREEKEKREAETIGNTLYSNFDCTRTDKITVQVQSKLLSKDTESIYTDFKDTEFKKSVVVINSKEIQIDDEFRKIQIDRTISVDEKVRLLNKICYMDKNTNALIRKFIELNILVTEAQAKMLVNCVYDVAIKSLDYTVAKGGESFSYFYEIYLAKEKEDMESMTNDFIFIPNFKQGDVDEKKVNIYDNVD